MDIKPLRDIIFIEKLTNQERTIGGILLLGTGTDRPAKGKVKFVGPGTKDDPMSLKPGDEITYPPSAGEEVEVNDQKYLILHESDILCIN